MKHEMMERIRTDGFIPMASSSRGKRGFTLLELLIVVAIIAILAGMLLPLLNEARKKANSTVCSNNLKQHGVVFSFYLNDYQGWCVPHRFGSGDYWNVFYEKAGYMQSVANTVQLRKNKWFFCPSLVEANQKIPDAATSRYGMESNLTSYSFNKLDDILLGYPYTPGIRLRPETQMVFADTIEQFRRQSQYYSKCTSSRPSAHMRHNRRANVAFISGHVRSLSVFELRKGGDSTAKY